ncbi:hypothetical protein BVY01_00885 [bacterium I07]|nr:hypothetical protein BVY01_00885 [bacterium I07]
MQKLLLGLVILMFAGVLVAQGTVDVEAEKVAIKKVIVQQDLAWKNRNLKGEEDVWANTPYIFRGFPIKWNQVGWEALEAWYKGSMERNPDPIPGYRTERSDFNIHVIGNAAWAVYHQTTYSKNAEGKMEWLDAWQVRFFEKIEGEWKIVLQMNGEYPEWVLEL